MTWNARYRKLEKRLPHDVLAVDELSQLLSEARAKLLKLISENDDAQPSEALAVDRAAARVRSLRDKPASNLEGLGMRECPKLSRKAVHRLLQKQWTTLTLDPELPVPKLSSFKDYCKGL